MSPTLRKIDITVAEKALLEAINRYKAVGDVEGALAFFWGASGIGMRKPNSEELKWAENCAKKLGLL